MCLCVCVCLCMCMRVCVSVCVSVCLWPCLLPCLCLIQPCLFLTLSRPTSAFAFLCRLCLCFTSVPDCCCGCCVSCIVWAAALDSENRYHSHQHDDVQQREKLTIDRLLCHHQHVNTHTHTTLHCTALHCYDGGSCEAGFCAIEFLRTRRGGGFGSTCSLNLSTALR